MKKTLMICVAALLAGHSIQAQILNMERIRHWKDSSGFFTGNIALAITLQQRDNSKESRNNYFNLENKNDLVYVGKKHDYMLINDIRYFNSSGGTFISTGYGHFRINFFKAKKLSYETFAQVQYDESRNMNLRLLAGGGVRWRITENKRFALFFGAGAMFEREKWEQLEVENSFIIKNLPKGTFYQSFDWAISPTVDFSAVVYYQVGYDSEDAMWRHRLGPNAKLDFHINKKIDFSIQFSGVYDAQPVIPIKKFIYTLENGIAWKF